MRPPLSLPHLHTRIAHTPIDRGAVYNKSVSSSQSNLCSHFHPFRTSRTWWNQWMACLTVDSCIRTDSNCAQFYLCVFGVCKVIKFGVRIKLKFSQTWCLAYKSHVCKSHVTSSHVTSPLVWHEQMVHSLVYQFSFTNRSSPSSSPQLCVG